jgi:diguanylate cyclase (GGDEF)-like protein
VEPVQSLILLAIIANLAVMAVIVVPILLGRRGPLPSTTTPFDVGEGHRAAANHGADTPVDLAEFDGVASGAYDRVVRIVSWIFILATSTIVALTGLWHDTQPAIFALLGAAGLFVVIVHDLLPVGALGAARFVLEGSVALTFATLLVVLTGRDASPFFFTFPLIVGGAALVVTPRITFALAAAACLAYLVAIAPPGTGGIAPQTIAVVGINITALVLLAYVATVIAREQRRARDAAIRLSTIDALTGLYNRTYFFAAVDREIARSARSGRGFCLLMMDLDELKQINDRHGHFFGDRVLRGVGEVIQSGSRRIDTAARYGGDEFVVLLPETDPTGAFVLAEKIRQEVADLRVILAGSEIRPSVSIGVVSFPEDGRTSDELMITADRSMYRSKRAGKNRVTGVSMPDAADDSATGEIDDGDDDGGDGPDGDVGEPVFFGGSGSTPAAARTHPNPSVVEPPPDGREAPPSPPDGRRGRSPADPTRSAGPRGNRSRKRPHDSV